jgi:hypothetical protein
MRVKKRENCEVLPDLWEGHLRRVGHRGWCWSSRTITPEQFRREARAIWLARHQVEDKGEHE